jgi:hypothetical protein
MLTWLSRGRPRAYPRVRVFRVCPSLESLERRDCPSAVLQTLSAVPSGTNAINVSGNVQDPNLSAVTINFNGAGTGTATPDANGNFSVTINTSQAGWVTMSASDGDGSPPAMARVLVVNAGPVILTLTARSTGQNVWVISGTVSGAAGGTVTLTGLQEINGVVVPINADGSFSEVATLSPSDTGMLVAVATDSQGNQSAPDQIYIG